MLNLVMRNSGFLKTAAALAAAAGMLLCGCDSEKPEVTEADNTQEISGAPIIVDDPEAELSEYPVTINDAVIRSSPEKVICLSSGLTEMIYELGYGDRLTGRGSYCDYPEAAAALDDYGKPASPDLDAILAASPDLLITATSIPGKDVSALNDAGITVLYISAPRSVEEFGRIYCALGMVFEGLFEGEEAGNKVFSGIITKINSCDYHYGRFIYVTEGGAIAGGDTFESSVLSILGENIAKDAQGYTFDKKLLADDQPDVIILNSDVPESEVLSDGVLGSLDAALNGRIIVVSNSYFESPSGRITGLLEELSEGRE
ncbi:MAG: ABC transporter substrate-binding protein [Ruminiclostridium sp.]|nr:ABC transporter substrate-binding protein [Ruminiclostridium sp.]